MKDQIKRRAGAMVVALALALSLAAPAWAADEPDESPPDEITGISFNTNNPYIWSNAEKNTWELEVFLVPGEARLPEGAEVHWSVERKPGETGTLLPTVPETTSGLVNRITNNGPGDFIVTAEYNGFTARRDVTISGITLTETSVRMLVGQSKIIAIDKMYGFAADGSPTDVEWGHEGDGWDIVSVMNGDLIAWQIGEAVIVAEKNGYSAKCTVEVEEDKSIIADLSKRGLSATTGSPLILNAAYPDLNQISRDKALNMAGTASDLDYITNVVVPTSQGTLYYNYNSEANTGEGVGGADRFSMNPDSTMRSLDMLYFVPRQGFRGTAEITFNGWSKSGVNFSGVIRVPVADVSYISYRVQAGEPIFFMTGDFNALCRTMTGRDLSYVTFNLPQTSQGVLYYNYIAGTGDRVSTSTQYYQSGRYTIDDVCFVPNTAYSGTVSISFRCVDTAGMAFNGEVVVNVSPSNSEGDLANVYISGERGKPVTFQSDLFNAACRSAIRDTLSYVTFSLPALDEGTLYYNYRSAGNFDSRVKATSRYFYSGVPGISSVTLVPDSSSTGRIAIPYTGYGSAGTSFTGILYITFEGEDRAAIEYIVPREGSAAFNPEDFNTAGLYQMGVGVEYVEFLLPDTGLGTLYYDYRGDDIGDMADASDYYLSPNESWQKRLELISFHAEDAVGTVTIPYTGYSAADDDDTRQSFQSKVVIQVGASVPADINLYCNTSGQVELSAGELSRTCRPIMSKNLSYIEITSVPDPEKGHLYHSYTGFGTGTDVKKGDRFYCIGSPNIDQLSFIPRAGFIGRMEITYIGCSGDGQEQVSGRIVVNVARSEVSRFFSDLSDYVWAIDSVDYLWENGTVEGVGGRRYNPNGTITKGDFTLMLVRAFGFTASGSVSYNDVSVSSYYADAIRVASLLGIAGGSNGNYNPDTDLSRQDAMLMIYNALKANGRTLTNGLAVDLSAFHDEEEIAAEARAAMGSLVQMGVVKGGGNDYLRPRSLLNRAETAMLLHTIMTL